MQNIELIQLNSNKQTNNKQQNKKTQNRNKQKQLKMGYKIE